MLRVVIILGILVNAFVGTHAISCLSCETGYEHLNECNRVVQCSEGQACYIERVMPLDGGRSKYLAGCRDMSLCNIEGCSSKDTKNLTAPSNRSDIVICSECCFRSLCNTQGCGGNFEANSTSIRCFGCPEVYGEMSCNTFTLCNNKTQMCQSIRHHDPHPGAVELGCGNRNKCIFSQQLYINQSLPLEYQALHCCDSHLCNWKSLDDTGEVESIANKLTCPPDLVERTTNAEGITITETKITNSARTTTATPPTTSTRTSPTTTPTTTATTTSTTQASTTTITTTPTTTTTKTTPAPTTTTSTTTPAPTTTITTTTPLPKVISTCSFEDGMCYWSNINADDFDWTLYNGSTPTDNTGPAADHTFGNAKGKYVFIETSAPRNVNEKARLVIFEASVGDGYTGDIALDDISITDKPCPTVTIVG
ncbi:hypothetical protein DPMN_157086 [Dreissena polymorpha]|uniref:MAM domain-containing protein n=1 Tax=Dreissena polymorpha TaxID=45954 RepID=A0A9D4ILY2_DREPO|nr:hypothetical protein DPMN_157086 [Dreissena polymorpha]